MASRKAAKKATRKVVTGPVPADYADLPEAERMAIADRLAAQIQAGLAGGTGAKVLAWLRTGQSPDQA